MAPGGMLFSSPARMAHGNSAIVIISSSPEFPSINDLVAKPPKKSALRSGSNAAAIPADAITSFTTAASVWRSSRAEVDDPTSAPAASLTSGAATALHMMSPELAPSLPPGPDPKPKPKRKAPAPTTKRAGPSTTKTTEPESAAVATTGEDAVVAESKPTRKRRTAKAAVDGQTTLPKGKVTKPSARSKATIKRTETVSRHFSAEIIEPEVAPPPRPKPTQSAPLDLDIAPRRRVDWTPPPEDTRHCPADSSSAVKEIPAPATGSTQPTKDSQRPNFKELLGDYSHKNDAGEGATPSVIADVLGKRKLVQMVATAAASIGGGKSKTPETSPTKTKLPKKKPRTITELATAAYRLPENDDALATTGGQKDTLLDYFETEATLPADRNGEQSAKPKTGAKKPAKPKVSKKKEDPRKQLVLSPESALKQVASLDFVFGTASQLATEEDPDLLRALHEAMKASNQPDDDPFCSSPVVTDLALQRRGGNKLWRAGARDDDGDVLDLEILDLTGSPEVVQDYTLPDNPPLKVNANEPDQAPGQRTELTILSSDFDDLLFFATQTKASQTVRLTSPPAPRKECDSQPNYLSDDEFEPPPSNQEHHQLLSQSQLNSPAKQMETEAPARPKYELFTDAQLARTIASYGFKAVKKRTAMITLLDQCWISKNTAATGLGGRTAQATMATSSKPTAPVPVVPAVKSPARPKARQRKTPATTTVTAGADIDAPPVKRARGRPKKDAESAAPVKTAKGKGKVVAPVVAPPAPSGGDTQMMPPPSTPRRRKAPAKEVLEIADSESDMDPFGLSPMSSPGGTQDVMFSPPQSQMEVSIDEDTEMSLIATNPSAQQTTLFGYITKAVTTAPPTKDPANPSWHEKILMYDPVILEDLTAWLNAGQLDRVGYDGEIPPGDVKRWCESKSVCCIWRVNLHGKERKRC
ncbi:hypothetical protein B0T16DRAFT_402612 [Cercophora newfieldiana]|uniref:Structure-specific endonuclease subunit SLX4 n=1 Tax=Cercophora newfieldiana TaxID=92897 RepID=A0AA39YSL8_9PEZI|nr:hypothetical protein B0T16DRAFT_402612 [Cercophora newfieldiana]